MSDTPKAKKYRVELSNDHEVEMKMAAVAAGLSVPDYMEQVVRPVVQEDLSRRLRAGCSGHLGDGRSGCGLCQTGPSRCNCIPSCS